MEIAKGMGIQVHVQALPRVGFALQIFDKNEFSEVFEIVKDFYTRTRNGWELLEEDSDDVYWQLSYHFNFEI